ncbi:hypothetical protein JCM6882_003467 [Rhodosporidiobolus microsporus]
MKPLSLLLPLSALLLSLAPHSALATPPPELIDLLSAAAAATPAAVIQGQHQHLVKRGGAGHPSAGGRNWTVFDDADEKEDKEDEDVGEDKPIQGGRHFRQSAPVSHGPKRLEKSASAAAKEVKEEGEDGEEEEEVMIVVVKKPVNGTKGSFKPLNAKNHTHVLSSPSRAHHNSTNSSSSRLSAPPRPPHYRPASSDRNSTAHLSPLDHEHRLRKRGIVDDVRSVQQEVEAKVGLETRTAELSRVSGKVTGDRNHYWYVDPSPAEDDHKAAHAAQSASESARASAAAERIANTNKDKKEHEKRGREEFEKARERARAARESVRAQKGHAGHSAAKPTPAPASSRSSSSHSSSSSSSSSKAHSTSTATEKKHGHGHKRRDVADWVADVGKELDAAEGSASSSSQAAKMVTSTRPPTASSTAAAPAASATTSEDGSLLDPSTWGSAISNEANDQYQSLKNKVDGLSVLSKIGLASLVLLCFTLLCLLTYCCCKLRIRRRRRRAAERVNASLAASGGRGHGGKAGGRSFDERATAIPMRGFGSASGPSGGNTKEDKKGKRRGSWKTFD